MKLSPPRAPHEALRPAPMRQMDWQQPPEQAGIIFGGVEGVYNPQNTPMLWQCIITITSKCFEGHTHPQNLQKLYPNARGVIAHPFEALAWSARPHMGRSGAISTSMVVAVVTPVVFVLWLQKRKNCPITITLLLCKLRDTHQTWLPPITSPKQKMFFQRHH
jgi:hypothetical protein